MPLIRYSRALAVVLLITTVVAVPTAPTFAAGSPVPSVSLTPASSTAMIGESAAFTVSFDNTSPTDVGYGPYVDLRLPIAGIDGNDGLSFSSASFLGAPVAPSAIVTCTGANVVHPLTGLPVACPAGQQLVVLQLPFGSFTPGQPAADLTVTTSLSNLADIGAPLSLTATPGFAYGNSPVGTTPIIGTVASATVTPQVVRFTKTYEGPEAETATGPNYPRRFRLSVDVANGQQVKDLAITDLLPAQYAFLAVTSISPAGSAVTSTPTVGAPAVSPNNNLTRTWVGPITGTAAPEDLVVEFEYFIPQADAAAANIIDPVTGNDHITRNDGKVSGTVHPLDPRDADQSFTIDPNVLVGPNPDDAQVTAKSIAVQKSVSIAIDNGANGASPGDVLQYTLSGQVSDYFTFGGVNVADVLGDGQTLDPSFTPTLTIHEQTGTRTPSLASHTTIDTSQRTTCGNGTTAIGFDVGAADLTDGGDGILTGGRVGASTGAATFTITFRATIDDRYACSPSTADALDPNDHVDNQVTVTGEVYDNLTQAPQATPQFESDDSATTVNIKSGSLSKAVYARNGVIGGFAGSPAQFAAGDTITYRLHFDVPTTDITNLSLADYLPLPVLSAVVLTKTAGACATPAAGEWCYGPADTFHLLGGAPEPATSSNSVANSITWNYPSYDNPANVQTTIELLFTLTVSDSPFRDGLFLTNQAQATYDNSFGTLQTDPAITQIELTEPNLRLIKGVVDADSPNETYSGTRNPTGVTFGAVGSSCPGFSPASLTSSKLNNAPNANASRVDAADTVRFAIVVENTGKGLHGAFDVTIGDTMPAGFSIPTGGLRLCVTDGLGTPLTHTDGGFFTGTPSSGSASGSITLTDNGSNGALTPDNPLHTSGTNLAVISYELQLDSTVAFQTTLTNTASITHFAASEGGPDFTPLLPAASATDTATVTTRTPTVAKTLLSTDQAHTTGNSVAIGEEATYRVVVTVPEGQAQNAVLVDTLPAGLALTGIDSITASAALTSSLGSMSSILTTTQNALASPGRPLTVSFGTLTNSDTDNSTAETITVVYRAIVLDVAGNQLGITLNNSARFNYTGGNSSAAAAGVLVAEPVLQVTKSASPANADAGDTVTYTILVQHVSPSNAAAFDVTLSDIVPAGIDYVPGSLHSIGPFAPSTISDSSAPTLSATWTSFPVGSSTSLQYQAIIPTGATAPSSIVNTAHLDWTSLPAGSGALSPFNTAGHERTGAGGVDDYVSADSSTVAITAAAITKTLQSTSATSTTANDVTIGETVTYDLSVTLPEGSIPAGFIVTDLLPNGLTFVSGSAQVISTGFGGTLPTPTVTGGATDGADVVLTFGATTVTGNNDPTDNSFVVRLTAVVSDIPGNVGVIANQTKLDNVGRVQLVGGTAVDSGIVRIAVVEPHMAISKSVNPTTASQGDTVTVSFTVENNGLSDAFDVNVGDVLDAHYDASTVAPVSAPNDFTFARVGSTVSYSGGTIPSGASRTFVITVALVTPLAAGTLVPNTATVTDATTLPGTVAGERNEPDVSSQANLNSVGPDLHLSKDDGVTSVTPGASTTYQLVATNVGGFQASGVYVDDTIPAGMTFVSIGGARCSDGGTVGGARRILVSGAVSANGGTVTCTITLSVDSPAAAGTAGYTNVATVHDDGVNGPDPTPDNNTNSDTDTLVGHVPDLSVTKNDGVQTRAPGETYTYTIHVANSGNIGVTNVQVVDALPAGLSFVSCQSVTGVVSTPCAAVSNGVSITYAGIAGGGGSASFTITVQVDNPVAAGIHQLVNHVLVTDDGANGPELTYANNTDSDTDNLDVAPDMAILKTESTSQAAPGDVIHYSLKASNEGLQDATGVVVSDTAPAGLTITCATASPAPATCDGTTITWGPGLADTGVTTGGTFHSGHSRNLTYDATIVAPVAAGTTQLTNVASVRDDGTNGVDPTPLDNTDSNTLTLVGAAPDLSITKTDGVTGTSAGAPLTYDIAVTNNGNIGATNVVVTDTLPTELHFVSCPTSPVTCDSSHLPQVTWTLPLLAGGGVSSTVQFTAKVADPLAAGVVQFTNPVSVADDGTNGSDPTPENNAASDTDTVTAAPDLAITKSDGATTRQPGETFDYTIVASNNGNQAATGVTVTDTLPSELVFVSCPPTPVGCAHSGEPAGGTVTWNVGSLSGGASQQPAVAGSTITLTVKVRVADGVAADVQHFTNTAHVVDDGGNGPDPTPGNNTATDTDTLTVAADMTITKTDGVTSAAPGDTLAYVLTVTNAGTQTATNVTVNDTLPAGVTFVSCSGGCDSTALPLLAWSNVIEDTPGSVSDAAGFDPGGTRTLTVTVHVNDPAAAGLNELRNTATAVDDGMHGVDPTPENNTATDIDTLAAGPDLAVTKDDGLDHVTAGQTVDYTMIVKNVGNQTATGVVATDTLPSGTTFVSCSPMCDSSATPSIVFSIGSLAAGGQQELHVILSVDDPVAAATQRFSNVVRVTDDGANGVDPTPENNTATDTDTYGVDLGVTKTDGVTTVAPGNAVDYTIVVTNHGPATIDRFTLVDSLPAALSGVTYKPSRGSYDATTGAWTGLGTFSIGMSLTLHVVGTVDPFATGTLTNAVTVTPPSGFPDRNPSNDHATDTDRLTPRATLTLVKELLSPLVNGSEAQYRLTVGNQGPSAAHHVHVVDTMPTSLVPRTAKGVGWTCVISKQTVTCDLADALAPDDTSTINVTAAVKATAGTTITNTATATAVGGVGGRPTKAVAEASGSVVPDLPATGGAPLDLLRHSLEVVLVGVALLLVRRRRHLVA